MLALISPFYMHYLYHSPIFYIFSQFFDIIYLFIISIKLRLKKSNCIILGYTLISKYKNDYITRLY